MKNMIMTCLWFDKKANEAANFYNEIFTNAEIMQETPMVTIIEIEGFRIQCLDGGPMFKPNPSVSFYHLCESENEIDTLWKKLSDKGKILMPLESYEWSQKYGWIEDKYGVSWQLDLRKPEDIDQKVMPALMFVGEQFGRGEEAIQHYTSIFGHSGTDEIFRYEKGALPDGKEAIMYAQFTLEGKKFILMENDQEHAFSFNEGVSLVVRCKDQEEVDYYWDKLTKEGEESMCGWLKDKFGVSWQVVPTALEKLMGDPAKAPKVQEAFMKMKKFDIEKLKLAAE